MNAIVNCLICGKSFPQLTYSHFRYTHQITLTEYKEQFPDAKFLNDEAAARIGNKAKLGRTKEHQDKLNAKNKANYANGRSANKGKLNKKDSAETVERKRIAHTGKILTEEHKQAIGDGNRGKIMSPEAIALGIATRTALIEKLGHGFNYGLTYRASHGQNMSRIALARTPEQVQAKVDLMNTARKGCVTTDEQRLNYRNGRIKFMRENPQKLVNTGGEIQIREWLELNNIEYKQQWTILPHGHPYDFYLPTYNLLVEFDGTHHWDRIWFNVSGLTPEEKLKRLDEQRLKDAVQNLDAGKRGYKIIRLQGWRYVGDAPGLQTFEEQLKQQGFQMIPQMNTDAYNLYVANGGTMTFQQFEKAMVYFEAVVVPAFVDGYNEAMDISREDAQSLFDAYLHVKNINDPINQSCLFFEAVDGTAALT